MNDGIIFINNNNNIEVFSHHTSCLQVVVMYIEQICSSSNRESANPPGYLRISVCP